MGKVKNLLVLCVVIQQISARSHGVRRDGICDGVGPETLEIKDDVESCGTFIACVGQVAQRFKCLSDGVYNNGSSVCLTCEENIDEYYEDEDDPYGYKKTTKKKFTYKQTRRTKSGETKKYGKPTRPPMTRTYSTRTTQGEIESTAVNNFTISFKSKFCV